MIGHIVYSKCGHDKGKIFVVVNENELYFYLTDGNKRLFRNPKRKKIKHVQVTNYVCDDGIIKKLLKGNCLDLDIRMAIKKYINIKRGESG